MFTDPAGQYHFGLPLSWAYDPEGSHLITVRFAHWQNLAEAMTVRAMPTFAPPDADLDAWHKALEERCFAPRFLPITHMRCGGMPAALAEAHEASPPSVHRRILVVRGPRLDVLAEHRAPEPSGGPRLSEPLSALCQSLDVPTNRFLPQFSLQEGVERDLRAAEEALQRQKWADVLSQANSALQTARSVYLHSVVAGALFPEIPAILVMMKALMLQAQATGYLLPLREAERLGRRALYTLRHLPIQPASGLQVEQSLREALNTFASLHAVLTGQPNMPSTSPYAMATVRKDALLDLTRQFDHSGAPELALWTCEALADDVTTLLWRVMQDTPMNEDQLSPDLRERLEASGANTPEEKARLVQRISRRFLLGELQATLSLLPRLRAQAGDVIGEADASAFAVEVARALGDTEEDAEGRGFVVPEGQARSLAIALRDRASALIEVGDTPNLKEAHKALDEASRILDSVGEEGALRAGLCLTHAFLLHTERRLEGAFDVIERGLKAGAREPEDARSILTELRTLQSQFLLNAGRLDEARALAAEVVASSAVGMSSSRIHSSHYLNLGLAALHLGDHLQAAESFREGLRRALPVAPFGEETLRLVMTASQLYQDSNPRLSLRLNLAAASVLDARRAGIRADEFRIGFDEATRRRQVYEALVGRLISLGAGEEAVAAADRSRARALNELLSAPEWSDHGPMEGPAEPPPTLDGVDVDKALGDAADYLIGQAEATLLREGAALPLTAKDVAPLARKTGAHILLIQPVGERVALLLVRPSGRITATFSEYALEKLLEWSDTARERLAIFTVSRGEAPRSDLPAPEGVAGVASESSAGAAFTASPSNEDDDAALSAALEGLWKGLIGPVARYLDDGKPLVVSPFRDFALVPFALLRPPNGGRLIDRHALSISPSLAVLRELHRRGAWDRTLPVRAYVVGDPKIAPRHMLRRLPRAREEAQMVASILRAAGMAEENVLLRLDEEAHEESYRQEAQGCDLVHLACHATVESPAYTSRLYFAPSGPHDGLLMAAEAAEVKLSDALVFLAACQTGQGRATADGVVGLGRAFLQAGARAVILSLRKVEDAATCALSAHFYRALLDTERPRSAAEALQAAMQSTRADLEAGRVMGSNGQPLASHVVHWGSFVLLGDGLSIHYQRGAA